MTESFTYKAGRVVRQGLDMFTKKALLWVIALSVLAIVRQLGIVLGAHGLVCLAPPVQHLDLEDNNPGYYVTNSPPMVPSCYHHRLVRRKDLELTVTLLADDYHVYEQHHAGAPLKDCDLESFYDADHQLVQQYVCHPEGYKFTEECAK